MQRVQGGIRLSATNLAHHLACRHLTTLERAAAEGRLSKPMWKDPALEVLQERGFEHERQYLEVLEAGGRSVLRIEAADTATAVQATRAAMREGVDVIVQATLANGRWHGRADVLLQVNRPTALGAYGYEVVDTKLARETRAGTMLQLCVYSEMVGEIQGAAPDQMHVVTPGTDFKPESYRVREYMAYYRWVRQRLESAVDGDALADVPYPEPVEHCEICRWWPRCDQRRRADDHLSLVAGISRLQRRELESWEVETLGRLGALPLPLARVPRRGSKDGMVRVREQARVQLEGRLEERPVHELLARAEGQGLARLPAPSHGDVYLDLEGDPFVEGGGLEFLFGLAFVDGDYQARWAIGRAEERRAFEETVDAIMKRWEEDPAMHVYHYGAYEPGAFKRLMGRHATRESEIDRLLRGGRFVDLHTTVKQALRASVEKYSIKDLEVFYGFERALPLDESGPVMRAVQLLLERGQGAIVTVEHRRVVEAYNRDDCVSAARLQAWLESLRAECEHHGETIARPATPEDAPSEALDEKTRARRALAERLLRDLPEARADRGDAQQAQWLLAHMLEWHRREEKGDWWEYFRLVECSDDELMEEEKAIGGLTYVERVEKIKRSFVDRYSYPRQETRLRAGANVRVRGNEGEFAEVMAIDRERRTIDLKKGPARADIHPNAVFEHDVYNSAAMSDALERLACWVADHGIDAAGDHRAERDLLLRRRPRLEPGTEWRQLFEDGADAARRLALALDHGVLPIQGPPGSGKTWSGASLIVELVRAGKRVGVTATSHKVIGHLLEGVIEAARREGVEVRVAQKPTEGGDGCHPEVAVHRSNESLLAAIESGEAQVAGGTSWVWARADFARAVDVLVIDEAGQFSLANTLAVAQAADSLVMLGDPRQLDQPVKGSHPEGAEVSALEHVLGGHETMPEDRGLFLAHTRRLHPAVCAFTSEVFYDGRLESLAGLDAQAIVGPTPYAGAGLWFVPVAHDGNQNASLEEVAAIELILEQLVAPGVDWIDGNGARQPLTLNDVLIVAPYNAQVSDLRERLPEARVGTVDKFQGQEAAVVIYSMTTSTPEDAPRGMDFFYSPNRLNVATSRARCACILVGSPRLFEPECQTPKQMRLANAFCRYREMARVVVPEPAVR